MSGVIDYLKGMAEQRKAQLQQINTDQGNEILANGGRASRALTQKHIQIRNLFRNLAKNASTVAYGSVETPNGIQRLPSITYYRDKHGKHVFKNNPNFSAFFNDVIPFHHKLSDVVFSNYARDKGVGCLQIGGEFNTTLPDMNSIAMAMRNVSMPEDATTIDGSEIGSARRDAFLKEAKKFTDAGRIAQDGSRLFDTCDQPEHCTNCDVCMENVRALNAAFGGMTAASADPEQMQLLDAARPIHMKDYITAWNNIHDHLRSKGWDLHSCDDVSYAPCAMSHGAMSTAAFTIATRGARAADRDMEVTEDKEPEKRGGFPHNDVMLGMPATQVGGHRMHTNYQDGEEAV